MRVFCPLEKRQWKRTHHIIFPPSACCDVTPPGPQGGLAVRLSHYRVAVLAVIAQRRGQQNARGDLQITRGFPQRPTYGPRACCGRQGQKRGPAAMVCGGPPSTASASAHTSATHSQVRPWPGPSKWPPTRSFTYTHATLLPLASLL